MTATTNSPRARWRPDRSFRWWSALVSVWS